MGIRYFRVRLQRAMTLIEVLIVLGLLAALAGITLVSVGDMDDSARATRTRSQAETMKRAIIGNGAEVGRFLTDMGRLPVIQNISEGRTLSEFFECPNPNVKAQTFTPNLSDVLPGGEHDTNTMPGSVSMHCGWNGPYLVTSGSKLYDGFGNDWRVELANDVGDWKLPVDLDAGDKGERIIGVASFGRDDGPGGEDETWSNRDEEIHFNDLDSASLTVTIMMRDTEFGSQAWRPVTGTNPWTAHREWAASTNYTVIGEIIRSADNAHLYRVSVTGTSGGAEPTWVNAHLGDRTDDGPTLKWIHVADRNNYADRVRVVLFVPYVPPDAANGVEVLGLLAKNENGAGLPLPSVSKSDFTPSTTWPTPGCVIFEGLRPGPRMLYAYAFNDSGVIPINKRGSSVLNVVLKPGGNFLTVYLTEDLN